MKPAVFKQRSALQLSYELPHYVYASAVYPLRSHNGSRIIIYGHEEGIRVIWYGGRSFRQPTTTHNPAKVNGTSRDEPMVIDLSDDDEPEAPAAEPVELEEEDDEVEPAEPYQNVLRYIDIELGTSATRLAVPHISRSQAGAFSESHASILSNHLVVAVACADLTIRLISLPLAPPAKSSDDSSTWEWQVVQIPSSSGHQEFITSISITDFAEGYDEDGGGDSSKSRSRSGPRAASKSVKSRAGVEWSFLVASTSCTGSGLLLVHRIPLTDQNAFDQSPEALFPTQRQLLRSPLSACRLSFNPCSHPADRASNILITLPDSGCVKVYQVMPTSTHARGRRASGATIDSTTSSGGSIRGSSKQQGKFLVTLYSDFLPPNEGEPFGRRKRPLDASWVLGGRAILVLFDNGDFGVWDLEAAGPPSATQTQNLVKGQSSVAGVQGGAQARLTIKGSLKSSAITSMTLKADNFDTTALEPMTPHTRRTRSDRLFEGRDIDSRTESGNEVVSRGNISVTELPQTSATQSSKFPDESVLLSYGDTSFHLPSLQTYWRTEVSGRGTFGTSSASKPNSLPPLRLSGQHIKYLSQFPVEEADVTLNGASKSPDFLATTEHTLILLLRPLTEESAPEAEHKRSLLAHVPGTSANANELLLQRGELGIDGLDSMLNDMTNGNTRNFTKSVGFDANDGMDVDMRASIGTPTPKLRERLRSVRGARKPGTAAFRPGQSKVRLFS